MCYFFFFFFQAEDGIRDIGVTGVQTCALPISAARHWRTVISRTAATALAQVCGESADPAIPEPAAAEERAACRAATRLAGTGDVVRDGVWDGVRDAVWDGLWDAA